MGRQGMHLTLALHTQALCKQCLATDMRSRPDFPEVVTILRRIVAELQ